MRKIIPILIILILQLNIVSSQLEDTKDIEFLGLELEKLVMLITALVSTILFIFTFIAYKRDGRSKLLYISIAFLLFSIKSFMLSSELFIQPAEWIEPSAILLELLAIISFFYGVLKKWNHMTTEKNEKILELEIRNKIFIFIQKYPGSHLREIERITKIPYSTLKYHLNYLNKHNLIIEKQEKGNNKYYSKTIKSDDINIIGLLKQKNIRKILIYLVSYKEGSYKELENFTNLAPSTIIWYIKKLLNKEIVEKIHKEKKLIYKIKSDKENITRILITYKESFFDSLLDKVIETWDIN